MIFGKPQAIAYAAMQSAKGAAATPAATDTVDFISDSKLVWPKPVQMVDRGLNRFGPYPPKQSVVGRMGEGSYNLEMRGSGVAGTPPNGLSPFLETLFGTKSANAAGTVTAGSGAVGGFGSALDLTVGQLAKLDIGTGEEIRIIDSKTGSGPYTYTVSSNFSEAPADDGVIHAGVSYFLVPGSAANFFTLDQYISTLRYLSVDAFTESMSFNLSDEDVIKSTFNVKSVSCEKTTASNPFTAEYDDTSELVGLECSMAIGGDLLNLDSLEFTLGYRKTRKGVNSTGISDAPFRWLVDAAGTFTTPKEDGSYFDDFFAGTLANIEMLKGAGGTGEQLYILLKDVQHTGPDVGDDDKDFQWSLPFNIVGGAYIGLF